MVKSCWICKTSGDKQQKSYYRIPKILYHRNAQILQLSAIRKEKWHKILALPYETSGIRICSDHFVSGTPSRLLDVNDPDWIPTQNLILKTKKKLLKTQDIEKCEKPGLQTYSVKCRLCMQSVKQELCFNIFNILNKKVLKMISTVLGHDVIPHDGMSHFACHACLKKIQICHKLLIFFRNKEKYFSETFPAIEANNDSNIESSNMGILKTDIDILHENENIKDITPDNEVFSNSMEVNQNVRNDICHSKGEPKTPIQNVKDKESCLTDNLYDRELILSIIENGSLSSDEESVEARNIVKYEKRKYDLQAVKIRSSEIKTLKCNNCYKKFINLHNLKMHKNFCKLFYCQLCKPQMFFKDKNDQLLHKQKYHSHSLLCHICGKNYSQTYLLKHFKNHFEHKRKCPCCDKMLKNATILMSHIDNVHGKKLGNICEFCGGSFKNLKKHLISCKFIQTDK